MYVSEEDTPGHAKTPVVPGFVSQAHRLSRGLLVRDELEVIVPLIVGQHDGDAFSKRLILQGDGGALSVLIWPDRADAGPDFLAALVFARGLAVVDEVRRGVWHIPSA